MTGRGAHNLAALISPSDIYIYMMNSIAHDLSSFKCCSAGNTIWLLNEVSFDASSLSDPLQMEQQLYLARRLLSKASGFLASVYLSVE